MGNSKENLGLLKYMCYNSRKCVVCEDAPHGNARRIHVPWLKKVLDL
jgi:hypothetical protein